MKYEPEIIKEMRETERLEKFKTEKLKYKTVTNEIFEIDDELDDMWFFSLWKYL